MKKLIFLSACLCFFVLQAQAQFKIGVRVGLGTTNVMNPSTINVPTVSGAKDFALSLKELKYGYHFGVVSQIGFGRFFVQPEVVFNSSKTDYNLQEFTLNNLQSVKTETYNYVDVPVVLGAKIGMFKIQAGPVAHVFLNSTSDLVGYLKNYQQNFQKASYGWQGGLGIGIGKNMQLDLKYEGNFSKYGEQISVGGKPYSFDQKPSRFIIGLSVFI